VSGATGSLMTKTVHTTNCFDTFIQVAEDCPARSGEEPPARAGNPTVAGLQYRMIAEAPYRYTSDDVIFATSAPGRQLGANATKKARSLARDEFFSRGPYLLGERITAADILWGVAFSWTMMFGLVPRKDVFVAYAERITSRPAFQRITAADAEMAAQHAAACGG